MSGGGQQPVTTTATTNTPWGPVGTGLSQTIGGAEALQQGGIGYNPYTGPTQTPVDWQQLHGEQEAENIGAAQPWGAPAIQSGLGLADTMQQDQGITPGIQGAIGGLGQVGQQYSNIYNQTAGAGATNPYLQQALASTIGNQINSSMAGAGRYGSGAHQEAIAAGEAPALAQDWQARQGLGLQATQGLGNVQGSIADIYGQGLSRAGQWAQLAPQLQQAEYMPSQMFQQIGNQYTQRAQQGLNSQIQLYNAQQAYPWEQLARENAIIGGAGGLGGSAVSSQSTQVPLGQRILGGGLAGAGLGSAFGPIGSGLGAAGGALAGGFL